MQSIPSKVALLTILLALCVNSQGLPFYFDPLGNIGGTVASNWWTPFGFSEVWELDKTSGTNDIGKVAGIQSYFVGTPSFTNVSSANCLWISGDSNLMRADAGATLNIQSNLVISCWLYPVTSQVFTYSRVINKEAIYSIVLATLSHQLWFYGSGTDTGLNNPVLNLPENDWINLVYFYNGSQIKAYTNGVAASVLARTGMLSSDTTTPITFGNRAAGGRQYYGGISSVAIGRINFTDEMALQLFNATRTRFGK